MFSVGDRIIYGKTGVCTVVDIGTLDSDNIDNSAMYYTLHPHFESSIIFAPVDGNIIPTRKILTKHEVDKLIDIIPRVRVDRFHAGSVNELTQHYKNYFNANDCADLIELTMSIYAKKQGGKFGAIDKKFMKQAENLLFGEFAAVLGIKPTDVPAYIESKIEAHK
jgi:CarD family transcriptional regulator